MFFLKYQILSRSHNQYAINYGFNKYQDIFFVTVFGIWRSVFIWHWWKWKFTLKRREREREMYSNQSTEASSHSECVSPTVNHNWFVMCVFCLDPYLLRTWQYTSCWAKKGMTRLSFPYQSLKWSITMETDILSRSVHVKFFLTLSLPREVNLSETSKLLNADLSDKT